MKHHYTIFLLSFLLFTYESQGQGIPSYVSSSGLEAWYPFTSNAMDSSGNGSNGSVTGASLSKDRFGRNNQAYAFNGNGNRIEFSSTFIFHDTGSKTLSLWYKFDTITNPAKQGTILKSNLSSSIDYNRYNLYLRTTLGTVLDYRSNNSNMSSNLHTLTIRNGVYAHQWHHLVITRKGLTYKMYVNGSVLTSVNDNIQSLPTVSGWILGDDPIGNLDFGGSIDDIGMWSRELSDSEIVKLYQAVDNRTSIAAEEILKTDVYPNPGSGTFYLDIQGFESERFIGFELFNSQGVLVFATETEEVSHPVIVLDERLPSGTYILYYHSADRRRFGSNKLILMR